MSNKENPRDPFNAFGGLPRFPPGLSPPFGWTPPIGNVHPQTAYNLPFQSVSSGSAPPNARVLQPLPPGVSSGLPFQVRQGPHAPAAPGTWVPSSPIRYPSLGHLARSFHEHCQSNAAERPIAHFGPRVTAHSAAGPVQTMRGPTPRADQQSVRAPVGFHLQQLINRQGPGAPAGTIGPIYASQCVSSPGSYSSLESLIPTRGSPARPVISVPEEGGHQPEGELATIPVSSDGQGNVPDGAHVGAGPPSAHDQAPGRQGRQPVFKFFTGGPDMRDVWFIRILSVVNPFDGRGHKAESYAECAKKLKAGPETARMFRELSDNPTSKTLSNRFNRLKDFLERDGYLSVVDGSKDDSEDLVNRLQMLIKDEQEYLQELGEVRDRRQASQSTTVLAEDLREKDARAMDGEATPGSSDSDSTIEGAPVPSEPNVVGGGQSRLPPAPTSRKRARRSAENDLDHALEKVAASMKALNDGAIQAHREQMAGTQELFAADLALKERALDFNTSIRTRELDLAERRLNHEVTRDDQTEERIKDLKESVARVEQAGRAQFEELKGLLLARSGA